VMKNAYRSSPPTDIDRGRPVRETCVESST
jgi:hypothetical protein